MIDGNNNFLAWERHTGDLVILPVGAFEQHGEHMPLKTDIMNAEYTAQVLAEHFDAALLPVLPIGNSLEHTGSRGSISLRPETLMQVITDIAEEVERQHFHFLIVVSGHGGNFALSPACRDFNRQDRSLKILLVFPGEFCTGVELESSRLDVMDIHAGEVETSRFLAMGGTLTGPLPETPPETAGNRGIPWRRQDLTSFGITRLNAAGYLGIPSAASKEKGEALLEAMHRNLIAYLEDRIGKLRKQWRYCGQGGVGMRQLKEADLPELLRLTGGAGWNQVEADWRFMLEHGRCLGFSHLGKVIASAVLMEYAGKKAWIGLVVVAQEWRGNRLAPKMLSELLSQFGSERPCKLDATPLGMGVYERLGFQHECQLLRMARPGGSMGALPRGVRPMSREELSNLIQRDSASFGCERRQLMEYFYGSGSPALSAGRDGFLLSRPGRHHRQLGPIMSSSLEDAVRLVEGAGADGSALLLDVPVQNTEFMDALEARGFKRMRPFSRMSVHGDGGENFTGLFAIAGPEFG